LFVFIVITASWWAGGRRWFDLEKINKSFQLAYAIRLETIESTTE
jgi:hypothetical protein